MLEPHELLPEESEDTSAISEDNGLPANGLPANGLPANGLPANGLPANGLPANGLPANGLPANGLSTNTNFKNWFHWFQGCGSADGCNTASPTAGATGSGTPTSRQAASAIMKYIAQCACSAGTSINFTDRTGQAYSWPGKLGLAPGWCPASGTPAAATVAEQEWVSACLMASINRHGSTQGSMQISVVTANPEASLKLGTSEQEDAIFGQQNVHGSVFYGNLFDSPTSGQKGRYAAGWDGRSNSWVHQLSALGRDCAVDGCGVFTVTGYAASGSAGYFPDSHNHEPPNAVKCEFATGTYPTSCQDDTARTWTRVVVARLSNLMEAEAAGVATAVCAADADNQERCSSTGSGTSKMVRLTSTANVPFAMVVPADGPATFRIRYKSGASGNVKFTVTDNASSSTPITVNLPSTGNYWKWYDFTGVNFIGNLSTSRKVTVSGVDATSTNVALDAAYLVLSSTPPTPPAQAISEGLYRFKTLVNTSFCMDVDGNWAYDGVKVKDWTCWDNGSQKFTVSKLASGMVKLVGTTSGRCLDVRDNAFADGTTIQMSTCNNGPAQAFNTVSVGNGNIKLVHASSKKCVEVTNGSTHEGTFLQLFTCNGTSRQSWTPTALSNTSPPTVPSSLRVTGFTAASVTLAWNASTDNVEMHGYTVYKSGAAVDTVAGTSHTVTGLHPGTAYAFTVRAVDKAGNISAQSASVVAVTSGGASGQAIADGVYRFRTQLSNGYCMDRDTMTTDGTKVKDWTCWNTDSQKYRVTTLSGGGVKLADIASNKCIEVPNNSSNDGTPIRIRSCNGSAAQAFNLQSSGSTLLIKHVSSGKCVTVAGGSLSEGTALQLAPCTSSSQQLWAPGAP